MQPIRTAAVLAFVFLTSCVLRLQPTIPTDSSPARDYGYVGVLGRGDRVDSYGFGLVSDASVYSTVPLQEQLALVKLPAGTYHVVYFAVWQADGKPRTRGAVRVDHPIAQPFELHAGEVVVLGNWSALTSYEHAHLQMVEFTLTPLPLTAVEAARAVRVRYPAFADAPVRCLACVNMAEDDNATEPMSEPGGPRAGWADPRRPGRHVTVLGGGPAQRDGTTGRSHAQDAATDGTTKPVSQPDPRLPKPQRSSGDVTDSARPSSTPWVNEPEQ